MICTELCSYLKSAAKVLYLRLVVTILSLARDLYQQEGDFLILSWGEISSQYFLTFVAQAVVSKRSKHYFVLE
jgi:hypothetical protein